MSKTSPAHKDKLKLDISGCTGAVWALLGTCTRVGLSVKRKGLHQEPGCVGEKDQPPGEGLSATRPQRTPLILQGMSEACVCPVRVGFSKLNRL